MHPRPTRCPVARTMMWIGSKKTMTEVDGNSLSEQALVECQELLLSAKVEAKRNSSVHGKLTAISILNMPVAGDPSRRRIEIVCHSAGHLSVEWDRLYVA